MHGYKWLTGTVYFIALTYADYQQKATGNLKVNND